MLKRKQSISLEEITPQPYLPRSEQIELLSHYKKVDQKKGGISFYDFIQILRNFYDVSEIKKNQILNDIMAREVKILNFGVLAFTANKLKKQSLQNNGKKPIEQNEYFNTFVALGGNLDGTGFVTKEKIIDTIRNQFQLPFDLNSISQEFNELDNQKINFDQFCSLFKNQQIEGGKDIGVIEREFYRTDSIKTVKVSLKDFEHYVSKKEYGNI